MATSACDCHFHTIDLHACMKKGEQKQSNGSNVLLSWTVYSVLVLARIFGGPFLPGYVHPDELFQSGQEIWFGYPPKIPWEFERHNALRSVLPPGLLSWLPLRCYMLLVGRTELSGVEVLIIPRFFCGILSVLAVDWSLWSLSIAANTSKAVPTPVLLLASSWPTMVLLNRPFSNSLETCFFALLLSTMFREGRKTLAKCMAMGILCALGIFTRFTFVFFAFPVMLSFLHKITTESNNLLSMLRKSLFTAFSFLIASMAFIFFDSVFYARYYNDESPLGFDSLVVTPWNALAYNSNILNLQEHGLHPRWTHSIVNMFLLYGPLTAIAYLAILSHPWKEGHTHQGEARNRTSTMCALILISGLGFLSLAPHQEPRFLLPLLVPLVLLVREDFFRRRALLVVWIVFNAVLFGFFGVLHQSGVVQSLLWAGTMISKHDPSVLIYYHTYMPPTFLLRPPPSVEYRCRRVGNNEEQTCQQVGSFGVLVDLNGSDLQTLIDSLELHLSCSLERPPERHAILAMPSIVETDKDNRVWSFTSKRCSLPGHGCQIIWQKQHHLSTEDLPPLDDSLQNFYHGLVLNVFNITCAN